MPAHRKYSQELEDAAVAMVRQLRRTQPIGAIAAVARELQLRHSTVQAWVERAIPDTPGHDRDRPAIALLPLGLLCCRTCRQPMTAATQPNGTLAYTCPPSGCRQRPLLDAHRLLHTVGRAVLRHAPQAVPSRTGRPATPRAAAAHAPALLHQVIAGDRPDDLTFTWRPYPGVEPLTIDPHKPLLARVAHACQLIRSRKIPAAHALLRDQLAEIDPAAARPDTDYAQAAAVFAETLIRLGDPTAAISWATYAHHSHQQLHGEAAEDTITATHILATAHRHARHFDHAHRLYRDLVAQLSLLEGPESHRTLAAAANLAVVLHAQGHHQQARTLLAETAATHLRAHPGHPATIDMLTRLATMHSESGHHVEAINAFAAAQALAAASAVRLIRQGPPIPARSGQKPFRPASATYWIREGIRPG